MTLQTCSLVFFFFCFALSDCGFQKLFILYAIALVYSALSFR